MLQKAVNFWVGVNVKSIPGMYVDKSSNVFGSGRDEQINDQYSSGNLSSPF